MDETSPPIQHSFDSPITYDKHINWVKILAIVGGILIVFILGVFFGGQLFLQNNQFPEKITKIQPTVIVYPTTPPETQQLSELISSNNIDNVMLAIKTGHVPDNINIDNGIASSISIKAFHVDLNINNRFQKLEKYLNISEVIALDDKAKLTNNIWKIKGFTEASDMYTKDGYVCIVLRPNRFDSPPYMNCSNAINLSENTFDNVGNFMLKTLSEAGIDCESEKCEITEMQEAYPLNKYGKQIIYFDKNVSRDNDSKLIVSVNKEAEESAKFFESSGWTVELEQYTDTEKKWDKSALVSILVKAENNLFNCKHEIAVMFLGKRQVIECNYKDDVLEKVQKFYNPYK